MDLLKETLALSDNAGTLVCDIEKLDYISESLINNLELKVPEEIQPKIIDNAIVSTNIMLDYIIALEKNIKKVAQQTDAVFQYIKEQAENGKEKIEN